MKELLISQYKLKETGFEFQGHIRYIVRYNL